jgi:hypothetical protein
MQIISNVYEMYGRLVSSLNDYFGRDDDITLLFVNIFGPMSCPSVEIAMARGIYYDNQNEDQSHTFSVAKHLSCGTHDRTTTCSFSVIENVCATYVLNVDENELPSKKAIFLHNNSSPQVFL